MQESEKIQNERGWDAFSVEELFGRSWRDDLADLPLFDGEERYKRGTNIGRTGSSPDEFLILKKGRLQMITADGRRQSFESSPDDPKIFGLVNVLSGTTSSDEIRAQTTCIFDVVKADDLKRFLTARPEICFRLTRAVSSVCRNSVKQLANV